MQEDADSMIMINFISRDNNLIARSSNQTVKFIKGRSQLILQVNCHG